MTPAMWDQTINELLSILAFLVVVTIITLVLLRRDKVRADRLKRMNR
jgi:energy-converting hydrogenase Eha subunit E